MLCGRNTEKIFGGTHAEGLQFDNGDQIGANLVVIAAGIRPNTELARQAGSRETRWSHLLSGAPDLSSVSQAVPAVERVAVGEIAALRATVDDLQAELARTRADVDRLLQELGISK